MPWLACTLYLLASAGLTDGTLTHHCDSQHSLSTSATDSMASLDHDDADDPEYVWTFDANALEPGDCNGHVRFVEADGGVSLPPRKMDGPYYCHKHLLDMNDFSETLPENSEDEDLDRLYGSSIPYWRNRTVPHCECGERKTLMAHFFPETVNWMSGGHEQDMADTQISQEYLDPVISIAPKSLEHDEKAGHNSNDLAYVATHISDLFRKSSKKKHRDQKHHDLNQATENDVLDLLGDMDFEETDPDNEATENDVLGLPGDMDFEETDPDNEGYLPFESYIYRNCKDYHDRILVREDHDKDLTHTSDVSGEFVGTHHCNTSYALRCVADHVEHIQWKLTHECEVNGTAWVQYETRPFTNSRLCSERSQARSISLVVLMNRSNHIRLPPGECVSISTWDPRKGINLMDVDRELMGTYVAEKKSLREKIAKLKQEIKQQAKKAVTSIREAAKRPLEAMKSMLQHEIEYSEVPACLCCNTETIGTDEKVADHCKMAYTMGSSVHERFSNMTKKDKMFYAIGSLYEIVDQVGGAAFGMLGIIWSLALQAGNGAVCRFVCGMRKIWKYREYRFAKLRQVPGYAIKFPPFWGAARNGIVNNFKNRI